MQFPEKLDFLMNLTNTTNSTLALQIKLDASHISRLRRGERNALKNEDSIKAMAAYFARHCKKDYQQKAISDALDISSFSFEESNLSALIAKWLSDNRTSKDTVESFLSGFANIKTKQAAPSQNGSYNGQADYLKNDISVYYGIAGKRQAAIEFLSEVVAKDKPTTLMLLSEEATDWMAEDREFAEKWATLMLQLITKGNKIKVIHTVNRDLDEMLNAISQWMPLYMTGTIEPYYYPRKRDGLYKRSLFVAPNTAAIVSSSVGNMANQAANVLFRNKTAISAFEKEFNEYLSLCRPLMQIFTTKEETAYLDTLLEFEKEPSNAIIKTESISLLTMPESLAASVISRLDGVDRDFVEYHKIRTELFENNIRSYSFTEIIRLYDIEAVKSGTVKVAFSNVLNGAALFYTTKEYIQHLEHIVHLLETHENFHLCFNTDLKNEQLMVYAKEEVGALAAKTSVPPITVAFSETNIKTAFWDYLLNIINGRYNSLTSKNETLIKLNEYISQLKEHI